MSIINSLCSRSCCSWPTCCLNTWIWIALILSRWIIVIALWLCCRTLCTSTFLRTLCTRRLTSTSLICSRWTYCLRTFSSTWYIMSCWCTRTTCVSFTRSIFSCWTIRTAWCSCSRNLTTRTIWTWTCISIIYCMSFFILSCYTCWWSWISWILNIMTTWYTHNTFCFCIYWWSISISWWTCITCTCLIIVNTVSCFPLSSITYCRI